NDKPTLDLNGATSDVIFEGSHAGFHNVIGVYSYDADGKPVNPVIISDDARGETIGDVIASLDTPANELHFFIVADGHSQLKSVNADQLSFDNSTVPPTLVIAGDNSSTTVTKPIYFDNPSLNANGEDHFIEIVDSTDGSVTQIEIEDLPLHPTNDFNDVLLRVEEKGAGVNYQTVFKEGDGPVSIVDQDVSIKDVDDTNLESATITLTNGRIGDSLALGSIDSGIELRSSTSVVNLDGTLTLTLTLVGSASLSDYEDALKNISFTSNSENPDTTDRIIEITVNDGDIVSDKAISTIKVIEVNDDPTTSNVALDAIAEDNKGQLITSEELLKQAGDHEGDNLKVTNLEVVSAKGTLSSGSEPGTWVYIPAKDDDTEVTFTYTITDDGTTAGSLDAKSVQGTASLDIIAVNDAPTTDNVILSNIVEDSGAHLITSADLLENANDIENDNLVVTDLKVDTGNGSLVKGSTEGTWLYTPAENDDSDVTFTY
ncbi:cadherin-like domain-containing protein, partial [Vibrio sp. 99-8-1]|uniref:cadherin-like domain-containing protein n=1 Tax=Vibrio sp. 99-8-1 TaxID=2607602 RepID=UPI001493C468